MGAMRFAALAVLLAMPFRGAAAGDATLIRNVTVVSAERHEPLVGGFVLVRDGLIEQVSAREPVAPGADVIDGTDLYLTPGLIDAHVHLAQIPGMRGNQARRHPELAAAYRRQAPRSFLYFGYTTLVDLNAVPAAIERFTSEELHPDVCHCDRGLVPANGYPMAFEPSEHRFDGRPNFLWDDRQADSIPEEYARQDHLPAALVHRVATNGGRCVKTYWDDGAGIWEWPTPTVETGKQIVEAAHTRGLPVLLHSNSLGGNLFAVRTGVDAVVHGMWHWSEYDGAEGIPDAIVETLEAMVHQRIAYMPTMSIIAGENAVFDPTFLDEPNLAEVVPGRLLDWYRSEEGGWFAKRLNSLIEANWSWAQEKFGDRIGPQPNAAGRRALQAIFRNQEEKALRRFLENDGLLLFGSDTPSSPTYANPPGLNSYIEMRRWADVGIPPAKVFDAATRLNADFFGLDDRGTIEPGRRADLLLLRRNPLETVEAWDSIETVIVAGRVVSRPSLSARAAENGAR